MAATPESRPHHAAAPVAASGLNNAQMEAVHHLDSPCLVLAGAGSGKTRVITYKIVRLLQHGLAPKNIAAITFTNKASQEMRERAKQLVGARAAKDLAISTFHSLGVRMLREDGRKLGLKEQFSILDSDDVMGVLKEAGAATDNKLARQWQWTISLWKNMGVTSDAAMSVAKDADEQVAARVMRLYEERLQAYGAVDFDDLIGFPLKLLERDEEARTKWQKLFQHVLVDEYQDTNAVQYELLKQLVGAPETARFTAVGDDDQSIYGWRGATIDNLKRLPAEYPTLKVIPLEQNYRSTGAILRAANEVIALNPKIFQKKLWSDLGMASPCKWCSATARSTRPNARSRASRRCAATTRASSSPTSPCCTAPTTSRGCSSRSCARRRFRTRSRVARASSTAPRSRTCARGCG